MKRSNLFLLLIFIPFVTNGQISQRIDSLALEHASEGFNGNILYSKNDSIIFTGNYGFSDFSDKRPLIDDTIFDLASISKQFTAVGIIQLIEKGMLTFKLMSMKYLKNSHTAISLLNIYLGINQDYPVFKQYFTIEKIGIEKRKPRTMTC